MKKHSSCSWLRKKNNRGTVTVETALGMFLLMGIIFSCMEISYMGFVSALVDYAVSESSREARTVPSNNYKKIFEKTLKSKKSLWNHFIDPGKFKVDVYFYSKITNVLMDNCGKLNLPFCAASQTSKNNAIAIYRITYPYQPMFVGLFTRHSSIPAITRESIVIQEYERDGIH